MDEPSTITFGATIADVYDSVLVPLIFQDYADELARRVARLSDVTAVLEIAAGTGVVTRAMASLLPQDVTITATDFSESMLARARTIGASRDVTWRQADAMSLPFDDESFDAVVCQFGVMFFPDRANAYDEVRRVLRPGGRFIFDVWGPIEANGFANEVTLALEARWPDEPFEFIRRVPYGYHDRGTIARDLRDGGFTNELNVETLVRESRAASPELPAIGICQGTPMRNELELRGPDRVREGTNVATRAVARRYGEREVGAEMSALFVTIAK